VSHSVEIACIQKVYSGVQRSMNGRDALVVPLSACKGLRPTHDVGHPHAAQTDH